MLGTFYAECCDAILKKREERDRLEIVWLWVRMVKRGRTLNEESDRKNKERKKGKDKE